MMTWWLSDPHYNHANIVKFCNRPMLRPKEMLTKTGEWISQEIALACAEESNRVLTRNINARVKPEDRVNCIGDFCCKGGDRGVAGLKYPAAKILEGLNGHWTLVEGNHDKNNGVKPHCRFMICELGKYNVGVQHKPLEVLGKEASAFADMSPELQALAEKRIRHIQYCQQNLDFMICGHVHDLWVWKFIEGVWHYNVSMDAHKLMPISTPEIITEWERLKRDLAKQKEETGYGTS